MSGATIDRRATLAPNPEPQSPAPTGGTRASRAVNFCTTERRRQNDGHTEFAGRVVTAIDRLDNQPEPKSHGMPPHAPGRLQ
jgi:hypothetical protein